MYTPGPEEDRCSGSILLPSYKISPVSKDDGVYRKFAFKAEHQVSELNHSSKMSWPIRHKWADPIVRSVVAS